MEKKLTRLEKIKRLKQRGYQFGENPRMTDLPEYRTLANIKDRTTNSNSKGYKHYGKRGITFSPEWNDYFTFLMDIGPRPSSRHQIDRIDNNKGYSKGNTRWTTKAINMQNTRNVKTNKNEVKKMRKLHKSGQSNSVIAGRFDVSPGVVSAVVNNRTWTA